MSKEEVLEKEVEKNDKKPKDIDKILEIVVVIMLGITALLTAWASWIGSLHGGNQATNYATSNNLAAEGNSEYNAGMQKMMQDMLLWNEVSDLQVEIIFAQDKNDQATVDQIAYKLFFKLDDNLSEEMASVIGWDWDYESDDPVQNVMKWLSKEEAMVSPFTNEDFLGTYFTSASELLEESETTLKNGQKDNQDGDAFGLVTVIYGVVLFLLGIAGSFKSEKNKYFVIAISLVSFLVATIYMFTIPMPTGFSITSFFVPK